MGTLKRHINRMAAGLMLAAGLASCTRQAAGPGDDRPQPGAEAYISLTVSTGSAAQQARPYETTGERTVNRVRMVLYEGQGTNPEVKYAFDFDIRTNENADGYVDGGGEDLFTNPSAAGDAYAFTTFARPVASADYKMLVVVNPDRGADGSYEGRIAAATAPGKRLSDLREPAAIAASGLTDPQSGIATDGHFLMTNHQGLVDVPAAKLRKTEELANANPVRVAVDRIVGKVIVEQPEGGVVVKPTGARISDITWEADFTNKWSYWMRVPTYKKGGTAMETPGDTDTENFYAEDPNFNGLVTPAQGDGHEYNFNILPEFPSPANALGDGQYVLENTTAGTDPDPMTLTKVVVRCVYTPIGMQTGQSYYTFNRTAFSATQMQEWNAAPNEDLFPTEMKGLKQAIAAARQELGIDVTTPVESFSAESGLAYFKDGVTYYSIPIRHFSGVQAGAYGYYGIVRNHVYRVLLNSINGPGEPSAPEDPSYVSAKVHILGWGRGRTQVNETGDPVEEPEMERSKTPLIWEPIYTDNYIVNGFGIDGSTITVTWHTGDTSHTTVNDGNWSVLVPRTITLYKNAPVQATQTEVNKLESDPVTAYVTIRT